MEIAKHKKTVAKGNKTRAKLKCEDGGVEETNNKWYTWALSEIYTVLGDHDKAIYWIEEAYK